MPAMNEYAPSQPPAVPGTRLEYGIYTDDPLYQATRKHIIMRNISSRVFAFIAVASLAVGLIGLGFLGSQALLGSALLVGGVAGAVYAGYKSWQHSLDVEFGPTDARSRLRSQNLAHSFQPILQHQQQPGQGHAQNQRADGQAWSAVVGNDGAQTGQSRWR